jgi:tRNA-binding protein
VRVIRQHLASLKNQEVRLVRPNNALQPAVPGLRVNPRAVDTIDWVDFDKVELRAGTIVAAEAFPEARKPAYKLTVDFGEFGTRRSSAQVTALYTVEELIGKQVVAVLNFPPKRIAGFQSECLVTGFENEDGHVALISPTHPVPNGSKLF